MHYGIMKHILFNKNRDDRILIENVFKETTRNGKEMLRYVLLALTPTSFIIGSEAVLKYFSSEHPRRNNIQELTFYPLITTNLTIFKNSNRNALKVCFEGLATKYFELESNSKKKTFWKIWNIYVFDLNKETKTWPFTKSHNEIANTISVSSSKKISLQQCRLRWIDKYLYLGGKREIEDQHRPIPIVCLGSTEFITLLNLKPQYFGS